VTILAPSDDHEAMTLILEAMAAEMDEYLSTDGLYRQLVVQAPGHTYHPNMTAGLVLDARRQAGRQRLPAAHAERVRAAESRIDGEIERRKQEYARKLVQELGSVAGSWGWYLDGCEHGDEDCSDTYADEVWLRTRAEDLLDEARRVGEPATEARRQLADLDVRLRGLFEPGAYIGRAEERAERADDRYWWLYGSARPA
jgi:hypothetical protein